MRKINPVKTNKIVLFSALQINKIILRKIFQNKILLLHLHCSYTYCLLSRKLEGLDPTKA